MMVRTQNDGSVGSGVLIMGSGHHTDQDTPLMRTLHGSGHLMDQEISLIRTSH